MAKIPRINDPYVGPVFGNILDMYDSPTYSMKLYMVRPGLAGQVTDDQFFLTEPIAPPGDTVILAQTGVTGNQIDDVVIDALVNTNKGGQLTCDFTITQPGAATFLDEIQMAKGYLGFDNSASTTLFLEIRFQGYTTDFDDNEEGGTPTPILGPLLFRLSFNSFNVSLDNAGSKYECKCLIQDTEAYRDSIFRTKQTITTTGSTITEHVDDFEKALNEWHSETTGHQVPDEIVIDLSQLIGNSKGGDKNDLGIITDQSLLTSRQSGKAETVNRIMNETYETRTKVAQQVAQAQAPVDSGTLPEVTFDGDNLSIKEGTTVEEYMYILLSMCPEFYTKITRKENIDEAESKVKKDQAFVSWFKVASTAKKLAYDPGRKKYATRYTFIPLLYKTANSNVAVDSDELNPTPAEAEARLKQYKANDSLLKAYNYMFTGLNDQIINLDISYDNGVSTMLPPKYGAMGEIAQTSSNKFSNSTPEGVDTSFAGRLVSSIGKAAEKADKSVFGNLIDTLNEAEEDNTNALGAIANQLSNKLGFSEADLLSKLNDKAERNALVESLDRETRSELGSVSVTTTTPATESPDVVSAGPSSGTYTPEASGYVYSSDFIVQEPTDAIDASTLKELGYISGGVVPPVLQASESTTDVKSGAEAATAQTGTTRNKLFGFITEQQNSGTFMTTIDLEIRGDPWYLAANDLSTPPNGASANFKRDDMLFWLRIGSPQKYDPDYRDEDNNTGYWQFDGTSQTFSGVYRFTKVTNKFSGGQYSVQVEGQRTLSLSQPAYVTTDTTEEADESETPEE